MSKRSNLIGKRFGRLVVTELSGIKFGHTLWKCKCDCGNDVYEISSDLKSGKVRSCGCLQNELTRLRKDYLKAAAVRAKQLLKHGDCGTRLYGIWKAMRRRCNSPNDKYFKDYGGRGIDVCPEWKDYSNFKKWALENGYQIEAPFGKCTIDRIDNNKGYYPNNCRWVDLKTQANNRRKRSL